MPITLRVAAATALLAALLTGLFPAIDRDMARLFFDAGHGVFPLAHSESGRALRTLGMWLPHVGWIAATLAILAKIALPGRRMAMRPTIAIFLIVTALAIPALLVNGGFKSHWGRPRPVQVSEFGGPREFKPWWDNTGTCRRNCSFMSGETSSAALLVGVASLAPLTLRPAAMIAAGLFTLLIGMLRVSFGGHWLSDVLLAGSVTVLLVLAARHIVLVSRGIDDAGIEAALAEIGRRGRSLLAARTGRLGTAVVREATRLSARLRAAAARSGERLRAARAAIRPGTRAAT